MDNRIIIGNGKSNYLKIDMTDISTFDDFKTKAENGTLLCDVVANNDGTGTEQIGTPLSKVNLLTDTTGLKYGVGSSGTINEVFEKNVQDLTGTIGTVWTTETAGYSQEITVTGMTANMKPIMYLDPPTTSVDDIGTAKEEFGKLYKIVTGTNLVKVYATEVTETSINVRFKGV